MFVFQMKRLFSILYLIWNNVLQAPQNIRC